jgi:hypothetical protein
MQKAPESLLDDFPRYYPDRFPLPTLNQDGLPDIRK